MSDRDIERTLDRIANNERCGSTRERTITAPGWKELSVCRMPAGHKGQHHAGDLDPEPWDQPFELGASVVVDDFGMPGDVYTVGNADESDIRNGTVHITIMRRVQVFSAHVLRDRVHLA